MQHVVVIVAGGSGKRFGSSLPKQFIEISKKPVIFHTIEKFLAFDVNCHFVIALQEDYKTYLEELITKYNYTFSYQLSTAGKERFFTVKNALDLVPDNCKVGIHDAVRPLVSAQTIKNCFEGLDTVKGVIPVVPVVNSLRKTNGKNSEAVDRASYVSVQTPQYFISNNIKSAYNVSYRHEFTDDATVFEFANGIIKIVDGNPENIKITNKTDLLICNSLL